MIPGNRSRLPSTTGARAELGWQPTPPHDFSHDDLRGCGTTRTFPSRFRRPRGRQQGLSRTALFARAPYPVGVGRAGKVSGDAPGGCANCRFNTPIPVLTSPRRPLPAAVFMIPSRVTSPPPRSPRSRPEGVFFFFFFLGFFFFFFFSCGCSFGGGVCFFFFFFFGGFCCFFFFWGFFFWGAGAV